LKGSFDTKGYIDFSPAMGADGSLYVEGGRSFHALKNPGQHGADRLGESASEAGFGLDIEDDFLFADGCRLRINK